MEKYLIKKYSDALRILSAKTVLEAESGHVGMPLGMADVFAVLTACFLHYNPENPKMINRDRLILSAGHGAVLLYSFYYLAGFKNFSLEDLKNFRVFKSKSPGHPEYGAYEAIEATTGPLGQGIAMAVGMAIAEKKLEKIKNINYKTYVIAGDGCLMQGISYEAASLAGHLQLDNLILLFDDNNISSDGSVSLTNSDDQLMKFKSLGWDGERINGHDIDQIFSALLRAQNSEKPYIICCRTTIGLGLSKISGTKFAHSNHFTIEDFYDLCQNLSWPLKDFELSDEIVNFTKKMHAKRLKINDENFLINKTDIINKLDDLKEKISLEILNGNPSYNHKSTRALYAGIIENLAENPYIIFGSADLGDSTMIKHSKLLEISKSSFQGNYINYGSREHAMGAIMNGLALSGFIVFGSGFLAFSDYLRPAIRMSAMQKLPVIYLFTHDSIMIGEDGPTHQPVEQIASLRAIPNLNLMRPGDVIESIESTQVALELNSTPTVICLSRQAVNLFRFKYQQDNLSKYGAYYVKSCNLNSSYINKKIVAIFSTGSEIGVAFEVARLLQKMYNNIEIKVISITSFFLMKDIKKMRGDINISIEFAAKMGWLEVVGEDGFIFSVDNFGFSGSPRDLLAHFKLTVEQIVNNLDLLNRINS